MILITQYFRFFISEVTQNSETTCKIPHVDPLAIYVIYLFIYYKRKTTIQNNKNKIRENDKTKANKQTTRE